MARSLALSGFLAACALTAVGAVEAAAATGDLIQKPGAAGCLGPVESCAPAKVLGGTGSVAVSPDSRTAYVASNESHSLGVFDRATDGTLSRKRGSAGCFSESGGGSCTKALHLGGAAAATVSPDGKNVYVASFGGGLASFDRARDGTLRQKAGQGPALGSPTSVTVSPDGRNLYVADYDGEVSIFDRARDGRITQKPGVAGCISEAGFGGCAEGNALDHADSVTISPDGRNAYVSSELSDEAQDFDGEEDGAVAIFDRAPDGSLTQKPGTSGCISNGGEGPCASGRALESASSTAISPNGRNLYVTSHAGEDLIGAVAVFDRSPSGRLSQKRGAQGCISDRAMAGCADGRALDGAASVTVSPDGENAYVAGQADDELAIFERAADGRLSQRPGRAGCFSKAGAGGCALGRGLGGAASVTVSPDDRSAYVASAIPGSVAVFDRELSPVDATGFRLIADPVELAVRNRISVLCAVPRGARLRTCSVQLLARGRGARAAARVPIGRGRTLVRRGGRARLRVRVRLNRRGRRLVRAALDGIPVRLEARAARVGAPERAARARSRVIARRQRIAPRRDMYAPFAIEPNAYGRRFLASVARGAGHLARVRCVGHAPSGADARALAVASARAGDACRRLKSLGVRAPVTSVGRPGSDQVVRRNSARSRRVEIVLTHRRGRR